MSFDHISSRHKRDRDLPSRTHRQLIRKSLLNGTFYDVLPRQFHEERNGAGEYIPLMERRPNIRSGINLLRTVVNDSTDLLFGEDRFPVVETADVAARECVAALIRETDLVSVMRDAAYRGSIGSVAIHMQILSKRVFFKVHDTPYLTPHYKPEEPDTLDRIVELYKVSLGTYQDAAGEVARSHWCGDLETGEFSINHGRMTNGLGRMLSKLVEEYSKRPNWRGYSYVDEMRAHALMHLCADGLRFDESRQSPPNPFGFYTRLVQNCFLKFLEGEKRGQRIKDQLRMAYGLKPSWAASDD